MNRRGFLAAIAAAIVLDPERALWVPGRKLISISAPRVIRPLFNVGDIIVMFGNDPHRFVCMAAGDPATGLGAQFAFWNPPAPWGVRMPARRMRP